MASAAATGSYWFHPQMAGDLPLVCLHGFAGAPSVWKVVAAHPDAPGPMVAIALPGHLGAPAAAAHFDNNVRLILGLLDDLGIGRAHVVGYSLGGRLALALARLAPDRIVQLTLVGTHPGLPDIDLPLRNERMRADGAWASMLRNDGKGAFFSAWQALPLFASQHGLPLEIRDAQSELREQLDAHRLAAAMEGMGLGQMPDGTSTLREMAKRVTLVTGSLDDKFTSIARAGSAEFPIVHKIIDAVGHNVVMEAPAQLARILATTHRAATRFADTRSADSLMGTTGKTQ